MKLLSFFGKGGYNSTKYRFNDKEKETCFSISAVSSFLEPKPEEIIIFASDDALPNKKQDLENELAGQGLNYSFVRIPLGKNDAELWDIFSLLSDQISSGSEISIDFTNGLRSWTAIAMLSAVFHKTGLNTKISHLFYGAYNVDTTLPYTPVFDLIEMVRLIDWGIAAERFRRDGDSNDIAAQFEDFAKQYAKESDDPENRGTLSRLAKQLKNISDCYLLLRPKELPAQEKKLLEDVLNAEQVLENIPEQKPLALLLKRMEETYLPQIPEGFSEDKEQLFREYKMIKWYQEHNHIMQAISLAREWLLSWFMWYEKIDINDSDLRKKFNDAIQGTINGSDSLFSLTENRLKPEEFSDFRNNYHQISDIRNDLMHAGQRNQPLNHDRLLEKAITLIGKIDVYYQTLFS